MYQIKCPRCSSANYEIIREFINHINEKDIVSLQKKCVCTDCGRIFDHFIKASILSRMTV